MLKRPPLVVGAAIASAVFAQTGTVPGNLLLAAQKSPWEFAMLLATASVPSGIELKEIDDISTVRPDYNFDQTSKVPASELATMFNTQHRDYAASIIDGVIVIRPADGRVSFLDQPSTITGRTEVTGLLTAAKAVFLPLDPRMTGPAVSSMLGDVDRAENARIVLTGTKGKSALDLLNDIVRQTPRTWYVATRKVGAEWQIARFGFFHGRGATSDHNILPRVVR